MKIPSFGVDQSLQRWVRYACRLGALVTFVAGASVGLAQTLVGTTLAGGFNNPYGVAVDATGNAYVVDTSNHVIKKVTSAGVVSVLAGTSGTTGTSNTLPGTFNAPRGIAINSTGTVLYVSDSNNNMIRVITLTGAGGTAATITTLAGTGTPGAADAGASSTFNFPVGIAVNAAGDTLYVADRNNNAIRSIVIAGPVVSTLAVTGGTLSSPTGVAVAGLSSALFVADTGNHVIRRIALPGLAMTTYAGTVGVLGNSNNATGTSATFNLPAGLAVDAADNLYVADFTNNAIRLVAVTGTNAVSTPVGGAGVFAGPNGVAVKSISGTLFVYVADTNNHRLIQAAAPVIATVGSPSNQTAAVGANGITFTASVTGGWPTPTLQWQRQAGGVGAFSVLSNTANYSGVTTATLTVNGVTVGMQGDKFKLVATNTSGAPESAVPATLTVTVPPVAPTFPTPTVTLTATVGQAATFANPASGSPTITYSVTGGSAGIFTVNTSTGTITGTPLSTADSVVFAVTATNGTAPNATRTVTINAVITAPPVISAQPQPQTVVAGASTASFSVGTTGSTPAVSSYVWERQIFGSGVFTTVVNGVIGTTTFSGATTATLGITGVTPSMNGDIFRVIVGNGTTPTTSSNALLTVQGTVPSITPGTPASVTADPGLNATFSASVSLGNPTATLQWQRQAMNTVGFFNLTEGSPYFGTTTATLTVAGVNIAMSGDQFQLVATNINGTVTSNAATLSINSPVPYFNQAPQNVIVNVGQNAAFTATAIGNPTPSLRWQRQPVGSFAGFFDLNDDGVFFGTSGNTLTILSPTALMNGDQFRVVASNINGSVPSTVAALTVSSTAPTITLNPVSVIANVGQNSTFTANATGVPAPTLRWERQPSGTSGFVTLTDDFVTYSGTTSTTLTVIGVTAGMTGDVFRLVATNAGGAVPSASAILTVNLGTSITTFAGMATVPGAIDATGLGARFNGPASIVVSPAGDFYIADTANSVIRKMTANGVVTTIAGLAGSRGSVDGVGSVARFNSPGGVAVDAVGNVYVADTFSHTIRVVSPSGLVTTLAGAPASSGTLDGVGGAARFFLPGGLAVDSSGTVYVADTNNHTIRRVTSNGTVSTLAGVPATSGFIDSGIPSAARFNAPNMVVLDSGGNLYVADSQNNAIRKITPFGVVSTLAGSPFGSIGSADGTGSLATFNRPSGLATDSLGNVYVADTNNSLLRRITPAGEVVTLAGLAGATGTADGTGNVARFNRPFGVVVDVNGNIYVADTGNHTIRRSGTTSATLIVTQPVSRSAGIGQSVSFTVAATGTPTPTSYQWQRQSFGSFGFISMATDLTYSGVNTPTLTVTNVTSLMNGDQFRVVVANGVNPAAVSEVASLTIGTPPNITSPASATFQAGRANSFPVTSDSTVATTFTAVGLPSWATLDLTSGVLSGNPPDTSGSPFTITIMVNNGIIATQTFNLTVLPANLPPTITAQPASVTVDPGQSATLAVSNNGTAPFSYQWSRNNVPIGGATNSTLILTGVQPSSAGTYSVVVTNTAGTVTSNGATLVVNTMPAFTSQPHSQVSLPGGTVTYSVSAIGGSNYSYQWRKNGLVIFGATGPTLTLSNVTAGEAGNYDVVVTNNLGSVTSSLAQLQIATSQSVPLITSQPAGRAVLTGSAVTLSIAATGVPTPSFQWRKNGAPISGANGTTYVFSSAQTSDTGAYDVIVSNAAGNVISSSATLRVFPQSYAGNYFGSFSGGLGNFAIYVRDDNTGVFLGYLPGASAPVISLNLALNDGGQFTFAQAAIVSATATDEGVPARAAFLAPVTVSGSIGTDGSVSGSLLGGANASLSGNRAAATGPTQNTAGFYQAGAGNSAAVAYTITGANSQALVVTVAGTNSDGGSGTVAITGQVSVVTARSVITELINTTTGTITGSSTGAVNASFAGGSDANVALQRLVNISSRARVGTADAVAIAGFVISGVDSKPVLIRAVGPTLGGAPFNIAGALTSPRVELFRGSTSIASNSGIASDRIAIDAAGQRAAAFALGALGTDAAILTTLAPGNYTAVVSSTTNAAGVALVEVYDLSAAAVGQKLLNISTRAAVGTADNLLIAGFVVPPGTTKRVLIRGVGPGLGAFGVQGVLAQPVLTLFSGSTNVATNTNWSTSADAAAITAASLQVGAFGLSTNDSAMIATLAPGNYTAQVVGVGATTGIALIEVYELP